MRLYGLFALNEIELIADIIPRILILKKFRRHGSGAPWERKPRSVAKPSLQVYQRRTPKSSHKSSAEPTDWIMLFSISVAFALVGVVSSDSFHCMSNHAVLLCLPELTTPSYSIGDAADAGLAMMVVRNCEEIDGGLPSRLRMMMLMNVLIDFVIGLVPFIGDLADAVYKCNTRNAVILEKHLREKGHKATRRQSKERRRRPSGQDQLTNDPLDAVDTVDHSLPEEWDKQESGVANNSPPEYREHRRSRSRRSHNDSQAPTRPEPARQAKSSRGFGRWFGGASHPEEDLERGR